VKLAGAVLLILIFFNSFAEEVNVHELQGLSKHLQLFIAPRNEDEISKVEAVCKCVLINAQKSMSSSEYKEFSLSLTEYATHAESAMADFESMIKNGPPRPSLQLMNKLQGLSEYIESCARSEGVEVEF
jgi:hypothetical protein